MKLRPKNLVILLSDEHNSAAMGCAGHAEVLTPRLDALAARGTRFTAAYTASPICVPARTALANGRYVHEAGYWDNVDAWDGKTRSWHHVLRDHGHTVVSIGKLHYRGWAGDDYGFTESQIPMHIHEGRGELRMLLRNPPPDLGDGSGFLGKAGPGESDYTRYDRDITARALKWIADQAARPSAKPWVLMVSIVAPHFPLIAPQEFHDIYAGRPLAMPKAYRYGTEQPHPFLQLYSEISGYNRHFRNEDDVRRALAAYYGLTSFMDDNMGRVLDAIDDPHETEEPVERRRLGVSLPRGADQAVEAADHPRMRSRVEGRRFAQVGGGEKQRGLTRGEGIPVGLARQFVRHGAGCARHEERRQQATGAGGGQ